MMIKFTTTDGRTVETTDKNVLIAAAKSGEIRPDTVVTIGGKNVKAGHLKGLAFGDPKPVAAVAPPAKPAKPVSPTSPDMPTDPQRVLPDKIGSAFEILRGLAFAVAGVCVLAGFLIIVNNLGGEERRIPYIGYIETGPNYYGIGVGAGMIIGSGINAYATNLFLDILAYIAKNVTKKGDK